jgi:hypothetical protein
MIIGLLFCLQRVQYLSSEYRQRVQNMLCCWRVPSCSACHPSRPGIIYQDVHDV